MPNSQDTLESYIDKFGLSELLQQIANVCAEKADHIRASYDDDDTAESWEEAEHILRGVAEDELPEGI